MKMEPEEAIRRIGEIQEERIIFPEEIIQKPEETEIEIPDIQPPQGMVKPREKSNKKTIILASAAAVILVALAIIAIFQSQQGLLTGYIVATREIQQAIEYNGTFEHYTETRLEVTNITSLRISGTLEGTRAIVKLRVNGVEYLVADIAKLQGEQITGMMVGEESSHTISTDKTSYSLGETVTITITPDAAEKSLYVAHSEETTKLDGNTYLPAAAGEYTAIALIVLPEDIIRIETNFTVIEQIAETANQTNTTTSETPAEPEPTPEPTIPTGYEFTALCTETCNLAETTNPTLIVELEPDSKLTITELITTRITENSAPEQTKNMPDIILQSGQTTTLSLNEYFADNDGDTVQYDINEIPEINAQLEQSILTLSSDNPGVYTAYIYATDGDKLITSNTFTITITETAEQTNETAPAEPVISGTTDSCSNPDVNLRPSSCFVGVEDLAFEELTIDIQDQQRERVGLFTRYGNLVIRGLLLQNATGEPGANNFQLGFSERSGFVETRTTTAWISTETGNLHLRGRIYENQDTLEPSQFNTFIIRNKHNMILGYFDELTGDLYLRGNIVQLGKV